MNNMRFLIIFLLICGCTSNVQRVDTKRRDSFLRNDCQLLFIKKSIGATVLNLKANDLLNKIQRGVKLSQDEDVAVIMIMNTIARSDIESINIGLKTCNFVFDLQKNFDESYLEKLRNKYTLCTRSSTLKFKELKIGYIGNPSDCSYYILASNPNEQEKTLKNHEIVPEKIRL